MKTIFQTLALLALCTPWVLRGQYELGSTGAYGPMNITASTTLNLPDDGIFHCTTITIASGAVLKFNRNSRNTPVYLLATGDVAINGTIDVSGETNNGNIAGLGGPGGYAGGMASIGGLPAGDGYGPGGGLAGDTSSSYTTMAGPGSFGSRITNATRAGLIYGSALLIPIMGGSGSGGAGIAYGGSGGGARF
jgi:hypothetical protein